MFKSHSTMPPSPAPTFSPPERDGDVLVFTSRDQLIAWNTAIHERPRLLREVDPQHLGDVSGNLALLAAAPHGGTLLMLTPPGSRGLHWLRDVREEHAPRALRGPFKVRVEGEPGVLIGVASNVAPTFWDHLEPDGWPVPGAADVRFDDRRTAKLTQAGPFAAPVGRSEQAHREQTLLDASARRWFRGKVVPTLAGLVALGDQPEKHLPGCAVAIRRTGWSDQLHRGSLTWLAERVANERSLWGQIPSDIARALVVLALAERAWVGPDADTPITLTVEGGRVRLAVPTTAANASEREDRASANPRLRHLLVRCGDLPALPDGAIMDNDTVLAVLGERYPGGRCDFEPSVTWLTMPLAPEARVVRTVVRPAGRPATVSAPVAPPPIASSPMEAAPPVAQTAAPTQEDDHTPSAPRASPPTQTLAPPRPRRPGPPPIFHPRPAPAAPAPHRSPDPPPAAPGSAEPTPAPQTAPAPAPTVQAEPTPALLAPPPEPTLPPVPPAHPTGPMSIEERKAQLKDLFRASDRPLGKSEIAALLGVHRDTLRHAINALVAEGWLEPTDTNRNVSTTLRHQTEKFCHALPAEAAHH